MSKQFVMATWGMSAAVTNEITAFIKAKNWNFWHWFDDIWLLASVDDSYTSQTLYNEILKVAPDAERELLVIFDMSDREQRSYFGRAPNESWDWMQKNWGKAK